MTIARALLFSFLYTLAAAAAQVVGVGTPAAAGSSEPFLSADASGHLLLSWIEPSGDGVALRFARFDGKSWSAASTIASGRDFFVNWADIPSVVADSRGTLFAHWLQKSAGDTYAYDVRFAISSDQGRTWSAPALLNRDGRQVEHGFASLASLRGGGVAAVWLDGRNMPEGKEEGEMTLRYARIDARGVLSEERVLDERVCECCTTAMAATRGGPLVAYRDRSNDEIRDISIVRRSGAGWTEPTSLHRDGWHLAGCPVNGPQLDARGDTAVAAWFSAANGEARVSAAFSRDGGKSFSAPLRVDAGAPAGRVDVVLTGEDQAVVVWLESSHIVARRVSAAGRMGPLVTIGASSVARSSGFPRAALAKGRVYIAWTEPSTPKTIHLVRLEP